MYDRLTIAQLEHAHAALYAAYAHACKALADHLLTCNVLGRCLDINVLAARADEAFEAFGECSDVLLSRLPFTATATGRADDWSTRNA